jgi:ribonucleoside-diphosphate reductase alpha chain
MLNVSGGIEPVFSLKLTRKTESLHKDKDVYYEIDCNDVIDYKKINNIDTFPDYFITANDIDWKNRIDLQAIAQEHIDTAISSTVNLSKDISLEEVEKLYLDAWKYGLKGITIYRDGCKRSGILTNSIEDESIDDIIEYQGLPRGFIEDVPEGINYRKYKLSTGCGKLYFFLGVDEDEGKIYDCFCNTDGVSGCNINTQAVSRLLSAGIRGGIPINHLVSQLDKAGVCPSYQYHRGKGEKLSKGKACASSIGNVIKEVLKEFHIQEKEYKEDEAEIEVQQKTNNDSKINIGTKCPECGELALVFENSCCSCKACGYSRCS